VGAPVPLLPIVEYFLSMNLYRHQFVEWTLHVCDLLAVVCNSFYYFLFYRRGMHAIDVISCKPSQLFAWELGPPVGVFGILGEMGL
jgi:hypothetical protein